MATNPCVPVSIPPASYSLEKEAEPAGVSFSEQGLASMASVGFGTGVAAVAPASLASRDGRRRRFAVVVPAATRSGGSQAAAKEEKGLVEFIFGALFKEDQLVETDPLLNKVDGAPSSGSTVSRKAGGKKPADGGGGFNLVGLFAKKE